MRSSIERINKRIWPEFIIKWDTGFWRLLYFVLASGWNEITMVTVIGPTEQILTKLRALAGSLSKIRQRGGRTVFRDQENYGNAEIGYRMRCRLLNLSGIELLHVLTSSWHQTAITGTGLVEQGGGLRVCSVNILISLAPHLDTWR
jgi:hypothetical protein